MVVHFLIIKKINESVCGSVVEEVSSSTVRHLGGLARQVHGRG